MAPVAEEFKALAEDILSSARERQRAIADMKSGVSGFLTSNEMERLREFRNAHDRIRRRVSSLAEETRQFLSQCNDEQQAVAEELRRAADELRRMAANGETARLHAFCQMHDRIATGVAELAAHTRRVLSDCKATQRAVAEELHRAADELADFLGFVHRLLADGDETRLETFRQMHDQVAGRVAELIAGTRMFLRDFNAKQRALEDDLRHAANELRRQLADGDNARLEAFHQMHDRIADRVAGLARETRSKLEELHDDFLAARAVWQDLASARSDLQDLASARSGLKKSSRRR
jgi:gas vesicle GvpC-like protein